MPVLTKARDAIADALEGRRMRKAWRRLATPGDPTIAAIAAAVARSWAPPTADEAAWIARIEGRRAALATSREAIADVDFGAGRRREPRNETEAALGVRNLRTVASLVGASKSKAWCRIL